MDDAERTVQLPPRAERLFAAGGPAEVLLYTLAPDRLVGRNRVPEGAALDFFPPVYRRPVPIRQLPDVDDPAADAELRALKPDLYVDYGTVHQDYVDVIEAVERRTGVPGVLIDGALSRVPDTYRRLGDVVGMRERGERLASATERLLEKYRSTMERRAPRVYLACSSDGFVPCLADERGGEALAWLGGVNVAGTRESAPRRPWTLEEIRSARPDAVVVLGGAAAAARLKADRAWQQVEAVSSGHVYGWPSLPFSWGARPPSVNRLPGLVWLAYVARSRPFDDAFWDEIGAFYRDFYHLDLTDALLTRLLEE